MGRRNTYNPRLQPFQSSDAINNSDSSLLMRLTWNWGGNTNSNGNLYGMTAEHGGAGYAQLLTFGQSYGYDVLNRVVSASDSGGWSRNFGYDQWGNMWVSGSTGQAPAGNTPTINAFTKNQLPSVSYDPAGNQSVVNGNTVTYDAENHQVSVAAPPVMGSGVASPDKESTALITRTNCGATSGFFSNVAIKTNRLPIRDAGMVFGFRGEGRLDLSWSGPLALQIRG